MKKLSLVLVLLCAGLVSGPAARAQESAVEVAGATTVDAAAAKALFDKGVKFVDVRTNELWKVGHIPGATHLELFTAFKKAKFAKIVTRDQPVVIYCAGPGCKRSSKACVKAVSWGFKEVYYFRTGFPAWKAAGYPSDPP